MKLKLMSKESQTADVTTWTFESPTPLSPIAGQYFHYVLPHANPDSRGTERWFTNSAAPAEGHIQITARLDLQNGSSFKKALNDMSVGQEIEIDGPEGSFTIEDFSKHYVFVAGGIGITPFRSILVEAKRCQLPLQASVLYGNRTNDIAFRDELDQIAYDNPNVTVNYITDPDRISAGLIKQCFDEKQNSVIYISGPEPMVKSLAEDVKKLGVEENKIKIDDFPGYEGI